MGLKLTHGWPGLRCKHFLYRRWDFIYMSRYAWVGNLIYTGIWSCSIFSRVYTILASGGGAPARAEDMAGRKHFITRFMCPRKSTRVLFLRQTPSL